MKALTGGDLVPTFKVRGWMLNNVTLEYVATLNIHDHVRVHGKSNPVVIENTSDYIGLAFRNDTANPIALFLRLAVNYCRSDRLANAREEHEHTRANKTLRRIQVSLYARAGPHGASSHMWRAFLCSSPPSVTHLARARRY